METESKVRLIMQQATPLTNEARIAVIEKSSAAIGITFLVHAFMHDRFSKHDLQELTTTELNDVFEFVRISARMFHDRSAGAQ